MPFSTVSHLSNKPIKITKVKSRKSYLHCKIRIKLYGGKSESAFDGRKVDRSLQAFFVYRSFLNILIPCKRPVSGYCHSSGSRFLFILAGNFILTRVGHDEKPTFGDVRFNVCRAQHLCKVIALLLITGADMVVVRITAVIRLFSLLEDVRDGSLCGCTDAELDPLVGQHNRLNQVRCSIDPSDFPPGA